MLQRNYEKGHIIAWRAALTKLRIATQSRSAFWSFQSPKLFVIGLLSVLGISAPFVAQANMSLGSAFIFIIAVPIYGYLTLLAGLMWTAGKAITWLLNTSLDVVNYYPVTVGWQTSRDVVNMLIIIVLLYVIFATVFGSSVAYKQVLPRVLIAAILVNFSRLIVSIPIELSNVLVRTFMPASLRGNFTESLLGALGVGAFWQVRYDIPELGAIDLLAGLFFNVVIFTVLAAAIMGVVIMFFIRLVVYMFLTVLAPFVFILGAIPNKQLSGLRNDWIAALTGWSIYGPVVAFFLMIALRVAQSELAQVANSNVNAFRHPFVTEASFESILVLILVVVLLFAAMEIGRRLQLKGSDLALKASNASLNALRTRTLPWSLRAFSSLRNGAVGAVGTRLGRAAANTSLGAGAIRLAQGAAAKAGPRLSAAGRAIATGARIGARAIADPSQAYKTAMYLPGAIMARMARQNKDIKDVDSARAGDLVNKLWRQPTNLEAQAKQKILDERVKEMSSLSPAALRERLNRLSSMPAALRKPEEMEAGMLAAAQMGILTGPQGLVNTPSFLNQHRDAVQKANEDDHLFNARGEVKMRDFLLEQYGGGFGASKEESQKANARVDQTLAALADPKRAAETRKQINQLWKEKDPKGFASAFQKADKVNNETARYALMSHLQSAGMSEQQALSALSRMSAIMAEKGESSAAGMVKVAADGTMSLGTKEFQASKIGSQIRRTGAKKLMETLKPDDLLALDAQGQVVGLSGHLDAVLTNLNVSKDSLKAAENSSPDLRQKLMMPVTMPDGTQRPAQVLLKEHVQAIVQERGGSVTGNLALRAAEMRKRASDPKAALSSQQRSALRAEIQAVEAEISRSKKRATQSLAHLLALEHVENGKVTGFNGEDITIGAGKDLSEYRLVAKKLFSPSSP